MFIKAKYVVGIPKSSLTNSLCAIVMPETMQHSDVRGIFVDGSITSAGFFIFDVDKVYVSGNSMTLNRVSRPADEHLVGVAIAHRCYKSQPSERDLCPH